MADKKRKSRDETKRSTPSRKHQSKSKTLTLKPKRGGRRGGFGDANKRRRGPGLPNSLRKEIQVVNSRQINSDDEDDINSDQEKDIYEYEEDLPQEESRKNRRFDPVENFEYELPENFKDENVSSSDDDVVGGSRQDDSDGEDEFNGGIGDDEEEGEDKGRHSRMLQGITGLPSEAFEGGRKKNEVIITEAYPESEYNPTRDVLDGGGLLSIQDLLNPLHGKPGFSQLRKRVLQVEKKSESVQAPLPMVDREKIERKVAYEQTKKDISKWEPLVKRNREAPTIYFDEDTNLGFSTVGSIASEFKPRTEFEKKMAALVHDEMLLDAHKNDGQRLLELNTFHLPNSLRKEIQVVNSRQINSDDEDDINSDQEKDIYEYEEDLPQEESRKNRRFDPVENFEYELPENFKDENVSSSDDDVVGGSRQDDSDGEDEFNGGIGDDEEEGEDKGRHSRMLQGITGLPSEAFEGGRKKNEVIITEAYPESEYNPTRDVLDGGGLLSIQDLLNPLHGKPGFSQLRKRVLQVEKKSESVQAPLPMVDREKIERKVAYEQTKKDISKWEPLVKRNREAPTIYFDEDTNLGFSTVGSIASEFKPRTEFEKKMAALVHDEMLLDAHKNDGQRLLELNTISVEDVKERESRLAKMRFMMFRHELKAKRVKKIKSKTYHRLNKKDRLPASSDLHMDPEAAKELALKQEFKRAEERLTMKHKNTSKWAKRNIKRGLSIQDEGTRAAMSQQLHEHALLTRKMTSMKDNSSSDESSDEDKESGSDQDVPSKLLAKAKEKTLKVLEDDNEILNTGVFSLPFMVRGLKKSEEAANEEAKLALQEYESLSRQLEDADAGGKSEAPVPTGRRVFGATQKQVPKSTKRTRPDVMGNRSDSEDDLEVEETFDSGHDDMQKDVNIDALFRHEESKTGQLSVVEDFTDIFNKTQTKTAYDVAIFAPDGPKKMSSKIGVDKKSITSQKVKPPISDQDQEEEDESSGTESEGQMVDGILSSGTEVTYERPSNMECIKLAFAGDDVEEDFAKTKEKILNEEVPEPEKPSVTPGWGDWASKQKKGRGHVPKAMLKEYEDAKKKQEEKLKNRKDANLKHVIISEKLDKKTEKLHTKTLPFPYTSKEVFEQSIRMPIGPEFNPTSTIGELNRPEVVKRPGVIIKPIQFEDVNPYEKDDEKKHNNNPKRKQKQKNQGETSKTSSVKPRKMR